jgi:spermidine/putrescine-binding protein
MARLRIAALLLTITTTAAAAAGLASPASAAAGEGCIKSPATRKQTCISANWNDYTYYDTNFKLSVRPYAAGVKSYEKSTKIQIRFRPQNSSKWVTRSSKAGKAGGVTFRLRNKSYGAYQIRLLVKVHGKFRVAQSEQFPSPDFVGD